MARKSKDTTPAPPAAEPLWSARATAGGRGTHLGVKWGITALLGLVLIATIFRAFFASVNHTTINEAPKVTISTAGEYAAAFVRDWFTWHDGQTDERTTRLSVYNPNIQAGGWNGRGNQTVTDARVFAQADLGNNEYRVTIRVNVDTSPAPFYVDVLTVADNGKYAVASVPTFVSGPPLAGLAVSGQSNGEQDPTVTNAITAQLKLFFASYAKGDSALGTLVLNGHTIVPIGGGVSFKSLDSVYVPAVNKTEDPNKRTVTAAVTWTLPNGESTASAAYSVDLEYQVGKWFVAGVRGGVADSKIAPAVSTDTANAPAPSISPSISPTPGSSASRPAATAASTGGTSGTVPAGSSTHGSTPSPTVGAGD